MEEWEEGGITLHPEDRESLAKILQNAKIKTSGTVREHSNLLLQQREDCHKRSYHRVSQDTPLEPEGSFYHDYRLCVDCEAVFGKDDMKYVVKPL